MNLQEAHHIAKQFANHFKLFQNAEEVLRLAIAKEGNLAELDRSVEMRHKQIDSLTKSVANLLQKQEEEEGKFQASMVQYEKDKAERLTEIRNEVSDETNAIKNSLAAYKKKTSVDLKAIKAKTAAAEAELTKVQSALAEAQEEYKLFAARFKHGD